MTTSIALHSPMQQRELKISNWFAEYSKSVLRFVKSKINDLDEAEDIAQDVWYQLSRQGDIETIEQVGAWLFTAARNRVINFYKKKKSVPFSKLEQVGEGEEDSGNDVLFSQWAEQNLPDVILESKEFWERLENALDKLPPEQRDAFVENELMDKSFKEMAEEKNTSINTLLARKRYAVQQLKKDFQS